MNSKVFQSIKSNLAGENRLLKFCVAVFAAVGVVNSVQIHKAMTMQRTIVLPPAVREKFEVTGDSVSEAYFKPMAIYITSLAFNYTASNARWRFDELLTMYAPESYPEARKRFYDLADKIEASAKATSVFHQQKIAVFEESRKMEVSGVRRIYSEDMKIEDSQKVYVIEYGIQDGRFVIYRLYEKTGEDGGTGGGNA